MKTLFVLFLSLFTLNALGYITENIPNGCGDYGAYYAVFIKNTYTCASGYFLPANTLGCQPCPNGYICNGGTFEFNATKSQGTILTDSSISSNLNNMCSDNFTNVLHARFEPNTIDISWYNGSEQITNDVNADATCTYNDTFNLPSPPSKPGYDFGGWRVKTTN